METTRSRTAGKCASGRRRDRIGDSRATTLTRCHREQRASGAHFLSEVVATFGLLLVIFALARSGRPDSVAPAVGAYIGAAYSFTSSTSFANPAVTVGRIFSNTFAGIAPASAPVFVAAQVVGGVAAVGVIKTLYPCVRSHPLVKETR
jgi:glycerol uptake facilitator-like aquaporin